MAEIKHAHVATAPDNPDAEISTSEWNADHTVSLVDADIPAGIARDSEVTAAITSHEAAADPHTGYVREADANWTDLTDGGETALHGHAHPDLAAHDTLGLATQAELDAHTADTTDAHDASAVSVADTGGYFADDDVEGALKELGVRLSGLAEYRNLVLDSSPLAYWRLGEASGTTAVDASGNGYDGTYQGSPALGAAGLLTGDVDTAVDFPGADTDYMQSPALAALGTAYTLAAWVEPQSAGDDAGIFISGGGSRPYLRHLNDEVSFVFTDATGAQMSIATAADNVPRNVPSFVVATHDGATARLYVNGVQITSGAIASQAPGAISFRVGRWGANGLPFTGVVDEAAVWDRALTDAEIADLYAAGTLNVVSLGDLADVDTTTTPPASSDLLTFNGTLWVPSSPIKNNYAATVAPGVGDDSADGYSVGSVWVDTTADDVYICLDASAGAAVWKIATDADLATHEGAADPHTGYQRESEKGAASGYASLDGSTKVPFAQLPTGTGASEVAVGDHGHTLDFGEVGDISAEAFGDTAAAGSTGEIADAGHRHAMPANPITAHEAAADPHTGYQRETEKGAASGYASLDGSTKVPLAQLPTGTTSSTVALGDAAAAAIAAHAAAGDPHTGYATDTDLSNHVSAADPHTGYVRESDPNWTDLTDGGATTLHSHAGGGASPWTVEMKNADESHNSSAVVADDSELSIPLAANTNYAVRLMAFFLTNATADLKYRLVFTGTTTRVRRRIQRTATTDVAVTNELKTAFDAADVVLSTTGLNPWLNEEIVIQVGASGGNLKLQWGQVTSNAGPTTCLEGSYMEYAVA